MKRCQIIIFSFIMAACHTMREATQEDLDRAFLGCTKVEIIDMMGPPTREVSDGGDGTILVYEHHQNSTTISTSNQNHTYYNTETGKSVSYFYMNSEGVCRRMRYWKNAPG